MSISSALTGIILSILTFVASLTAPSYVAPVPEIPDTLSNMADAVSVIVPLIINGIAANNETVIQQVIVTK